MSTEGGHEFLFHRLRMVGATVATAEFAALLELVVWHPFTEDVLRHSAQLVATGSVRGRDAVHAATALGAGFGEIVTADADFDGVPGLARLDPRDWQPQDLP